MTAITIFAQDTGMIAFNDKKGRTFEISPEGALFKGGASLSALKDQTLLGAVQKASQGRYRAAADIIGAAFGTTAKAFEKIIGTPWSNKSAMVSYLAAIERAEPGKNGYTKKQLECLAFVKALRTIPALASEKSEAEITIDMPATLRRAA
jgi:hypothetical protein